ncbi:hypothetical protein BC936DRAFT_140547 [Jimgerdemannia flammicorona]|uniref:Chromo domain-containing protein n=1 Tax=Jimgerdemannia flammicorona TaxID=994334 RepID=A0A433ANJ6_9FUNG|nr:hypothetical protein BC936DRAFT_140547 [Jimgerdemannia flammicorona]
MTEAQVEADKHVAEDEDHLLLPKTVIHSKTDASTEEQGLFVKKRTKIATEEENANGDAEDNADQEEQEDEAVEDEYEVEKILKHRHMKKGPIQYFLKWKGYTDAWNTWEDKDHVAAEELLAEYWESLSGKETALAKSKPEPKIAKTPKTPKADKNPAPASTTASSLIRYAKRVTKAPSPTPVSSKKKRRVEGKTNDGVMAVAALNEVNGTEDNNHPEVILDGSYPPLGTDWATEVDYVESVENDDEGVLQVYLRWKNGNMTLNKARDVHKKCLQQLIDFY